MSPSFVWEYSMGWCATGGKDRPSDARSTPDTERPVVLFGPKVGKSTHIPFLIARTSVSPTYLGPHRSHIPWGRLRP